jgi:hypothetical protein
MFEFLSWLILDIILVVTGSYLIYILSFGRINFTKKKATLTQSIISSVVGLIFWIAVVFLIVSVWSK